MFQFYGALIRKRAIRVVFLMLGYAAIVAFTLWLSYQLRFDFGIPPEFAQTLSWSVAWIVVVKLACLFGFGQFRDSLSYFSAPDLRQIVRVCVVSSLAILVAYQFVGVEFAPPRGVILTDGVLLCAVMCSGRAGLRFIRERFLAPHTRPSGRVRRVGIVGAGDEGAALARELLANRWLGLRPIAFFDDHRTVDSRLHGIAVWGKPERLIEAKMALKLDEIIIAFPSAATTRRREVVALLQKSKLPFRTIPSMTELAMGTGEVNNLRPVQIEDLLGREVVKIDTEHIREMIAGATVLVTGAGGSIGSELCRQIAAFRPRALLLVERSEAALFPIEQELIERGFHHLVVPLVADVTHVASMADIFATHHPQVVFHAAAHKHVPMMESQPAEAIRNNVLGTAQVAELAYAFGVARFVLISTDKAINPTSVMGATKRLAEITVQSLQARHHTATRFMAVRFGNVLGSSGSVVPIFARQIAAGGPVKVTHPEVTRFFMTIPEAVSLVLQSAARGEGGEIFVLDMGKPVKIVDLARQMIELSGLKPGADIQIEFTGLRPGEKLYEELSHRGEDVAGTDHEKILRLNCVPTPFREVERLLKELAAAVATSRPLELKQLLQRMIPEYASPVHPPTTPPPDEARLELETGEAVGFEVWREPDGVRSASVSWAAEEE